MFRFILAFILPFATAQNLGTYLSPCPASAPIAVIQPTIINNYLLGTDAQCLAAPPMGHEGWEVCPAPGVFDAFFTDTEVWFRCAESLSETCNGGCPDQELCISTQIPSAEDEAFFFCGVPCAGGFYLCDDTATKYLNPSYTAFCDPIADQCATCSSPTLLEPDGTCAPSGIVSALPVRASARKRNVAEKGYSKALREVLEEMDCPRGLKRCTVRGNDGDWECIAIMEDLESCGGCPLADGIDCTSIPGTTFGGVTCDNGRCVAHECLDAWEVVNSTCVTSAEQPHTETPEPTARGPHPDLSTEPLIPSALGSLSVPQSRQNLRIQDRSAVAGGGSADAGYHLLHRTQARVPEGTIVTVWLAYSGIGSEVGPGEGGREMGSSATRAENLLERIYKMPNVRIVEAGET